MLEDITFQKFWTANYPDLGTNQPLIMVHAFMEVAYKAWLAGQQSGIENGRELEREMSNTENNRYFH